MKTKYYALKAYAHGSIFPKFMDSYKTLTQIRKTANSLIRDDGYHTVEIMRDVLNAPGYVGIRRELIETIKG